ncbi:MAG: hypothetical protein EOP34_03435 [Rickettsiales bacterium]|nr:MAG: hypothetical protein EOP34_03435 [Rickettsiales bacterium]
MMFPNEDGMYIIPDVTGGETRFPILTKPDEILDNERRCNYCKKRHVKSVPKRCQGAYELFCRQIWYSDFAHYLDKKRLENIDLERNYDKE